MSLITRQRLFISLVAALNLGLAAVLTLNSQPAAPFAVIGVALLPLAWLAGRRPDGNPSPADNGGSYAA